MTNILSNESVEEEMRFRGIPGMAAAVMANGQLILCRGWGVKSRKKGTKVTEHTRFPIASCTKSMTSALIAMLVDEGVLNYDTPVTEYIPGFRLADPVASSQVTLRDLLCHRSGLGGHDGMWPGCISRAEFVRRLRYLKPNVPFRAKAQYSNVMYILIGHIAECVTGKSWEELVRERIFAPLGMSESSCTMKGLLSSSDYAQPYGIRNGELYPMTFWDVGLAGPAASVNSSAVDMAKWLSLQMNGGVGNGRRLIEPETFREMHRPQSVLPDSSGAAEGLSSCSQYGFGWRIGQYRGLEIQKHRGEIEGFSSIQAYLPERNIGAVLLTNLHAYGGPFLYTVLYTIFDRLLGLPQIDWRKKFHPADGCSPFAPQLDVRDLLPGPPVAGTSPAHCPTDYTGVFRNGGYGDIAITFAGKGLHLRFRDSRDLPMAHHHYETFQVDGIKEDTVTYSLPLTFLTDPVTGKVDRFLFRLEPSVGDILFERIR